MSRAAPDSAPADADVAAGSPPASPRWRGALAGQVALDAAAGLLAFLAAAVVLQLWNASLGMPLGYGGDGMWTMQVVKGMVDHGWFLTNPDVGAPFGQELDGGMKGRADGNWAGHIATLPTDRQLPYYAAAGFGGIWVDRRGYGDLGEKLDHQLRRLLPDPQPLSSEDEQLRFYSLTGYVRDWEASPTAAQRIAARDSALRLTDVQRGPATRPRPAEHRIDNLRAAGPGSLTSTNPGGLPRTVRVRGRLQIDGGDVDVAARLPGRRLRLRATGAGRPFALRLRLAPGQRAGLRLAAPRARDALEIPELLVTDDALEPR